MELCENAPILPKTIEAGDKWMEDLPRPQGPESVFQSQLIKLPSYLSPNNPRFMHLTRRN